MLLLNPVGSSFDYLLAYVAGVIAAPFYMYAQTLFIVERQKPQEIPPRGGIRVSALGTTGRHPALHG